MARAPSRSSQLRRQQAIDTLLELASELPPSQIRTAQISTRMGLSEAALFRHFPSKECLWLATLDYAIEQAWQLVEQAGFSHQNPQPLPPLQHLRAILQAQLSVNRALPGLPPLIFHELQNRAPTPCRAVVDKHLERLGRRLEELVRQVQQAAAEQPHRSTAAPGTDASSEGLAHSLLALVLGLLLQERISGTTPEQAETALETALSRLLPQQ